MTSDLEIRISGNGQIQHCPYNQKMNDTSWRPMIWYRNERVLAREFEQAGSSKKGE